MTDRSPIQHLLDAEKVVNRLLKENPPVPGSMEYVISADEGKRVVLINETYYRWNATLTVKVYDEVMEWMSEGKERTVFTFMEQPDDFNEVIEACFRNYVAGTLDDR